MSKLVTFYAVDVPGADRVYIWHHGSEEFRSSLQEKNPGTRVFRVHVALPDNAVADQTIIGKVEEQD